MGFVGFSPLFVLVLMTFRRIVIVLQLSQHLEIIIEKPCEVSAGHHLVERWNGAFWEMKTNCRSNGTAWQIPIFWPLLLNLLFDNSVCRFYI